jgi:hypothetical protein
MQKSKLPQFKKLINEMNEAALREELLKLYTKLPIVKYFYNQDLMTEEERHVVLKSYKDKIYKQFWTPKGNPKMANNSQIRSIIAEFEKIAVFPYDVIDLLIYRVETTTDHANDFVSRNPTTDRATFNGQSLNNNFLHQIFVRHLHILT